MRRHRLLSGVVTAVLGFGVAVAAPPASAASTSARGLLFAVPVAAENNAYYDRSKFTHWIIRERRLPEHPARGADHRVRVTPSYTTASRCTVRSGNWIAAWDGATWTNAADVDIDHHVALAEAWGSGARGWTSTDRKRFANDLYGPALNAITDNLNASRSDRDPAEWLPPKTSTRCSYAIYWVQVKYRWRLTMNSAERSRLSSILAGDWGSRSMTIPTRAG